MDKQHFKVLILGGGSGGISVAARLRQKLPVGAIAILEPSKDHFYQPFWTMVGAGLMDKEESRKSEQPLIPNGVEWIQDAVSTVDAKNNLVHTRSGKELKYDILIVATGLQLDWNKIEGLDGNLGKNGIISVYDYNQAEIAGAAIQSFQGGTAIFVMPPTPIKCAGAPQKIMYLAEDIFRKNGVRQKSKILFATAGKAMFGVPAFSKALEKLVQERQIEPLFQHKLIKVRADKKMATFAVTDAQGNTTESDLAFDLLHVVPTMSAHSYVATSGLAFTEGEQKGWLEVDKFTLQHTRFPNIFGIGDVTGVPNSKTGAAIRKQYPVVAENVLSVLNGKSPNAKYDGYSSCPLITEVGKVMLAEFGYDGKLMPTFPGDPAKSKRSMWILKKYILPKMYWHGMLTGRV